MYNNEKEENSNKKAKTKTKINYLWTLQLEGSIIACIMYKHLLLSAVIVNAAGLMVMEKLFVAVSAGLA